MPMVEPEFRHPVQRFAHRTVDFRSRILLMAVVNRTPDSFYDDGATFALDAAVRAARQAAEDGADWVDVGGVPFSPGPELPPAEEAERVVPVIAALLAFGLTNLVRNTGAALGVAFVYLVIGESLVRGLRPAGLSSEAVTVTARIPAMTPRESRVGTSGTGRCSPPLMKGRLFSCRACRISFTPMNPRMAAKP